MGKFVVSDNVSLDGVVQDPAGDEGFMRGGWVGLLKDRPELGKLALDEALGAEALLGRRSLGRLFNLSANSPLRDGLSTWCPRPSRIPTGTTRRC